MFRIYRKEIELDIRNKMNGMVYYIRKNPLVRRLLPGTQYRFFGIKNFFIIIGSSLTGQVDLVWNMADMFNGIMVLPNLVALFILIPQVKALLKDYNAQVRLDPKVFED
jgi:Na+/alanine symporter